MIADLPPDTTKRLARAVLDVEVWGRIYPDIIAKALLPVVAQLVAKARAEGAAEALEEAAEQYGNYPGTTWVVADLGRRATALREAGL